MEKEKGKMARMGESEKLLTSAKPNTSRLRQHDVPLLEK
jgi:hypothetical protein